MLKFDVLSRFSGSVQFTAEIDCAEDSSTSVKLGLAVKWAVKTGANLYGANLTGADLTGANLTRANLTRADLYGANLTGANLTRANLTRADLYGANLTRADLTRADLTRADLYGANLTRADLYGANLTRADLTGADLTGANNSELVIAQTRILPQGSLIGWKKCQNSVIVKLRIPEEAKRSSAFGRKCRAEFADVLEVFGAEFGVGSYDGKTEYHPGKRVLPDKFNEDWQQECAGGIHFFITREEAEAYT